MNQQADFRAPQDDAPGSIRLQLPDDFRICMPGVRGNDSAAQLVVDHAVDGLNIRLVGDDHADAPICQLIFVKVLGHSVFCAQKGHGLYAGVLQGIGCGVRNVDERDGNPALNLRRHLVHGVGADNDIIRPRLLKRCGGIGENLGALFPLAFCLIFFDLRKVYAAEQNFRGVQAAEFLFDGLIDNLIIGDGAFPAHAAEQAKCFHFLMPPAADACDSTPPAKRRLCFQPAGDRLDEILAV